MKLYCWLDIFLEYAKPRFIYLNKLISETLIW